MKAANLRVMSCLERYSLDQGIRLLDDAVRTARAAAEALGCSTSQIANSLIFRDLNSDNAVLIMCSGGRRVDVDKVHGLTGLALGKADAEFVKAETGFAIGGVAPVAHSRPLQTFLDVSLRRHEIIWAAAGTPESIFPMSPDQLEQMTAGEWIDASVG